MKVSQEQFDQKKEGVTMYKRVFRSGVIVNVARLRLLGIGKYAFETSLFGEKPFELNMNIPMFDTAEQAHDWIMKTGKWEIV